jgi:hypothetical protein
MLLLVSGSTKTVRRLSEQCKTGLGHLLTPNNRNSMSATLATGLPWAADNGAFKGFDPLTFRRYLRKIAGAPRCLFVVCPDRVADASETLQLWWEWRNEVEEATQGQRVAFVLQDGQETHGLPQAEAYFIGGSTRWKLSAAAADLAREAKDRRSWLHMGRVNSRRRMQIAHDLGCDSIDGSSASMFGDKYIHKYIRWIAQMERQPSLSFSD